MKERISVKEYARLKGISQQAVYKKLNTPLFKPYVIVENGKKTLDRAILDDAQINENSTRHSTIHSTVEQPLKMPDLPDDSPDSFNHDSTVERQNHSTVEQPLNNPEKPPEMASGDDLTAHLQEEVKFLREQIERLTDSLQFEQRKNAELSAKLHLLQAPPEDQQEPEQPPPPKTFRSWWHSFWNGTTPQK